MGQEYGNVQQASDISGFTVFGRAWKTSASSQGCLKFSAEPCLCTGVIILSLASSIFGASQKI